MTPKGTTNGILGCFLVLATVALIAAERRRASDPELIEVKEILTLFAGATDDMGDPVLRDARIRLNNKREEATQIVRQLFHESTDDRFRTAAIGNLFLLQGGAAAATEAIEVELAKNPSDWRGDRWVSVALIRLENVDKIKLKSLSVRALDLDKYRLQSSALSYLKKYGDLGDIATLQRFRERVSSKPPGEERDALVRVTDITIRGINERLASVVGSLAGDQKIDQAAKSRVLTTKAVPAIRPQNVEETESADLWSLRVLFGCVLFAVAALLALVVYRRRKSMRAEK